MQKTYMQTSAQVTREWHVIDANDVVLGKVATAIATKLIGKHKPTYTPHIDGGDYVVVINASKVAITGDKSNTKMYYSYSGFPGGLRSKSLGRVKELYPQRIIEAAVYNMLPKNKLRTHRMNRLKVYVDATHPHEGQLTKTTKPKATKE
jgi:large subunit ribosomal protein L13